MNLITDSQVAQVLSDQPDLIREAVIEAFIEHKANQLRQKKTSLRKRDDDNASDRLTSMMGFVGDPPRVVGFKLIGSCSSNPSIGRPRASVFIVLCDPATYELQYLVAGTKISLQRTAEIAVLGVQLMTPRVKKIVIVGNGAIAQAIFSCIRSRVGEVVDTLTYGRADIKRLGKSGHISADVVITATSANSPILTNSNLSNVKFVVNLGLRELSSDTIAAFDKHIVDDLSSCASQTTPFADALRAELIREKDVRQFSTITNLSLELKSEGRVYFQPSGMVSIDLIAAAKILESLNK